MKLNLFLIIVLLLSLFIFAQEKEEIFRVRYVSAENVYLDGGEARGLQVGDKIEIRRNNTKIAEAEVIYVAEHSASCKLLEADRAVQVDDVALVVKRAAQPDQSPDQQPTPIPDQEPSAPQEEQTYQGPTKSSPFAKFSGSVSVQLYHWNDQNESDLDFTQPTFRVNLKARDMWGKDYQFRIRTRTRYNQRTRRYSSDVPKDEWRNRVYEVSFTYDNLNAAINYKLGRIISNHISGIGYIDGLQVQHNITPSTNIGVFVGTQPDWRTSDFQTSIQKYGAFFNLSKGDFREIRFETTVAAAAEYHSSTVSREFFYIRNSFSKERRLFLYQSAEIDLNRDWRKELAGETLSFSNLFFSARYRFNRWLTTGITLDNRKNYWTYEVRTISEELFDNSFRRGLRGTVSLRLPGHYFIYGNAGIRKLETNSESTYSYTGGLRKANFLVNRLSIGLNYAGFSNQFTDGYTATFRIGKSFRHGERIDLSIGNYAYSANGSDTRNNQRARVAGYFPLLGRLFMSGQYEYDWGDDIQGQRVFMEGGYRF